MKSLDKTYDPHAIEQHWYQLWESKDYFTPQGASTPYCIMLPPPNVTGSLHMGHGFGFTLIDVLIRYHRMHGQATLWQAGTDHAGIATQMVVERKLNLKGKKRKTNNHYTILKKKSRKRKEEGGKNITRQLRRLGASLDWSRERFTLDDNLSYAVREVFIRLYQEGLIYRGERLVNWDPMLRTAVSDLEVINTEEEGKLWQIRYPLEDGSAQLIVATTRPETLFGDVAVAVHPDDTRYQAFIGKKVKLPLTKRIIPIIADTYVDPLFGTGCVKITPAHDFNDYEVGRQHQLTPINIFTSNAHLNENVPAPYQGLERFQARIQVIKELSASGLIEKIEKHQLKVPRGEKSGAILEPYLTKQWFMKMKPLAIPAIHAVEQGKIRFIPENWNKTYFQWMNHIEDWCISRQLWWGHCIPIWYDDEGKHYTGQNEQDVRERYQLSANFHLIQDEDVLDTWFSAALWPFSALGWPEQTTLLKTFFPTNVLVTGFDIIFFWVARMIMLSLKFTGQVPFREVYITGLIRDAEGHKMSKSKGNVLDPIDLIDGIDLDSLIQKRTYGLMQPAMAQKIEKTTRKEFPQGLPSYGTDALRFTFCSVASYTREIRFDTKRLAGYRNFCNKLWNASRYVLMHTQDMLANNLVMMPEYMQTSSSLVFSVPDRWIWSRLQKTLATTHAALAEYRFDLFSQALYDFTWNEFCDWYLELSKPLLSENENASATQQTTRYTLIHVLETLLRALHPIMPFITEEIWQRLKQPANKTGPSIMLEPYPQSDPTLIDDIAESEIEWLRKVVTTIRTLRSEMNITPGKLLPILLRKGTVQDKKHYQTQQRFLLTLAKLESICWINPDETPASSITAFVGELEIFIPMEGFLNKDEESARLKKEITKLENEIIRIENKLQNPQFIDKAPAEVVAKEHHRLKENSLTLRKLKQQLTQL